MRNQTILLSLLASLTASGCTSVDCGPGTIERNGTCEPADRNPDPSVCGPFTHLVGEDCVPDLPPTECGPNSVGMVDPETGVVVCHGTGGGGCNLACPAVTGSTKQSICGQIYDFEDMSKFQEGTMPDGTPCNPQAPAASGPCALTVVPYDAINFGTNPSTTQPLPHGTITVNNCGAYSIADVDTSGTTFIGIGVDDVAGLGPTGVSVTTAVAIPKAAGQVTTNVETFMVKPSTAMMWGTTSGGGVSLQTGVFAPLFRKHKSAATGDPLEPQAGVTIVKGTGPIPNNDFYFGANVVGHTTIDPAATATGVNGTGLVNNASVPNDGLSYQGQGGLGAGCRWELHGGASLPGIVYIQVFHKADIIGQTCND